jgi:glycopeptide antibiotics resistance protein
MLRFLGNPRSVDIDDVILNTLGACLGFACYQALIAVGLLRKRSEIAAAAQEKMSANLLRVCGHSGKPKS